MSDDVVLEARSVTKIYHAPTGGQVYALADVNVDVRRGRTLGLVGESGSGKTTLTRLLLDLEPPTAGRGRVRGPGAVKALTADDLRNYRHAVAAVFQNPYSSLDPRMRIWDAITEQQAIERLGHEEGATAPAPRSCSTSSGLGARMADRYPTSCRAVSASASPSPVPSPRIPRSSSSTSRCRRSTCRSAPRS